MIVNNDDLGLLPLRIVVPMTDWKDNFHHAPWMVKLNPDRINKLEKISSADCFQIRSISKDRFVNKIGHENESKMNEIVKAINTVIS